MALSNFTDNVDIIAALGDNPITDDNLTSAQFKAKFDEAANLIKTYINSVLVPNVFAKISGSGLLKTSSGTLSVATADTDYASASHHARHESGGADEIAVSTGMIGSGAVTAAKLGSDILPANVGIKMGTATPTTSDISAGEIYLKYEA